MQNQITRPARNSQAAAGAQPTTFLARDDWMRAVLADGEVSEGARIVAVRLALFLRVKTGRCDPGYEQLGRAVGISERSIFRRINELERAGWIAADRDDGRGKLTNFRLVAASERVTAVSPFSTEKRVTAASPFKPERVTAVTEKGDSAVSKRVTPAGRHQAKRSEEKRRESQTLPPDVASRDSKNDAPRKKALRVTPAESFQEFWSVFPRRGAKEAARRAFERAVKAGAVPETLIAGAKHYAIERAGQEPRYTKHPATWLNAGCWEDEVPGAPVIDEHGNVVAIEQAQQQAPPRTRGFAAIADELIAQGGEDWR